MKILHEYYLEPFGRNKEGFLVPLPEYYTLGEEVLFQSELQVMVEGKFRTVRRQVTKLEAEHMTPFQWVWLKHYEKHHMRTEIMKDLEKELFPEEEHHLN